MIIEVSRNIKLSEEEEKQEVDLIIEGKKITFYIVNATEHITFLNDNNMELRKMEVTLLEYKREGEE